VASCLPPWLECRPDQPGYALVRPRQRVLSFEHSQYLSTPLFEHVRSLGLHSVLLDLAEVEYLSSDVLGSLLHLSRHLRENGGRLLVRNLSAAARIVFTPFPERQRSEPNRLEAFLFLDDDLG
jgi:anti-anti-sigma regulatory factor